MITKDLDQITERDLLDLKDSPLLEGKTIEYKLELPGNSDADKKEFLADVSSFSNASGGDLIYGLREEAGVVTAIEGLAITDVDRVVQRLENIIRSGIEPRIPSLSIKPISLSNDRVVFIIRIAKSWSSPHRVSYKGHDKFYSRNSSGKYPLDVAELRAAFNMTEAITDRIREFITDRISKIIANEAPVSLETGGKIILHLIPIMSVSPAQSYDINTIANNPSQLPPIYHYGYSHKYNLDGFLTYSMVESRTFSYVQLFRNGIIEAVDTILLRRDNDELYIPSIEYEERIIAALTNYTSTQGSLNVEPPIFVFLTLTGVKNYYMGVSRSVIPSRSRIDRDVLLLPEVIIDSYNSQPEHILKPAFDAIWNACGYPKSINYDSNGKWSPRH